MENTTSRTWLTVLLIVLWLGWGIGLSAAAGPSADPPAPSNEPEKAPEVPIMTPVAGPAQPDKPGPAGGYLRETEPSPIEDLLLEKGVITMDDWIRIKAKEEQKAQELSSEMGMVTSPRWYERIRIVGYQQTRYALLDNPMMDIPLGDKLATSDPHTFYVRRIRMVFTGQISERLSIYLQPAFEGDQQNLFNKEMVDASADFFITKDKEHRLRFGLHRAPNAFDTYRSSTNRQEMDRHESVQSGTPGERDLGIAYYWTPKVSQMRYAQLATYHNGPGDYGDFAIMVYNGQTRNKAEQNADKHVGIRLAHPWELPNGRLLETGMMAFRGQFVVDPGSVSRCPVALHVYNGKTTGCQVRDERITWYVWTPPQPWGVLAEYTVGRGPKRDAQGFIRESHLSGGYVQPYYTWRYSDVGMLTGYVRYGEYYGGIKTIHGVDGRSKTLNVGLVWEPDTHWRFMFEWMNKNGLNSSQVSPNVALTNTAPQAEFNANLFRIQAQWFFN
jgi:hypothetical protein